MKTNIKFREFLESHHGRIDRIFLSYSVRDTPTDESKYDDWFNETNKNFKVDMDLMHSSQKVDDIEMLRPYLNLNVSTWGYFTAQEDKLLEEDFFNRWYKGENILEVYLD